MERRKYNTKRREKGGSGNGKRGGKKDVEDEKERRRKRRRKSSKEFKNKNEKKERENERMKEREKQANTQTIQTNKPTNTHKKKGHFLTQHHVPLFSSSNLSLWKFQSLINTTPTSPNESVT